MNYKQKMFHLVYSTHPGYCLYDRSSFDKPVLYVHPIFLKFHPWNFEANSFPSEEKAKFTIGEV
jgi:hypothetical protein